MAVVTVSTVLAAPADRVWAAVKTPGAFKLVTRGLLTMPSLRTRTAPWRQAETVSGWVFLFGVVPFSRHHLTVECIDDDARVLLSDEQGGVVRSWRHRIEVTPIDEGRCRYVDRIDIDAGPLTALVTGYAHAFYRVRQRRWRQLAPALVGHAGPHTASARPPAAGAALP